jgi:hypothetical protein
MAEINRNLWDRAANTWRRLIDTATVAWDVSTPGQASAGVPAGAIGTTQLADDAVTNAKLANMVQATIKGRADAAGTGDPTDLTAAQVKAILGSLLGSVALQVFTAPGANTYTPTTGMLFCLVISTGGGGGGGSVTSDSSTHAAASGGGAGATCAELFSAATIGASQTVTVGSGGPGGTAGGNGTQGADTTFGALHTAGGGPAGVGFATNADNDGPTTSAAGGAATGGLINIPGAPAPTSWTSVSAGIVYSGDGAASFWGGGPNGTFHAGGTTIAAGRNAAVPGAAGTGASARDATSAGGLAGGDGADGICVVIELVA